LALVAAHLGLTGCGVSINTGGGSTTVTSTTRSSAPTNLAAEAHELTKAMRAVHAHFVEDRVFSSECLERSEPEKWKCPKEWAEAVIVE
jgi:hypothetical protein